MNISEKIFSLRKKLHDHNYRYYVLDDPLISDYDFDMMLKELNDLEKSNPEFFDKNSPTQRVGGEVTKSFNTSVHETPMYSLDNSYSLEDLKDWEKRIKKIIEEPVQYTCELKFDGVSINLLYSNGELIKAVTRGDGVKGDDVTANIKTIPTVPLKLIGNFSNNFEARGEVVMPIEGFNELNKVRIHNGEEPFKNPRNTASGSLKLQDSKEVSTRPLECLLYSVEDPNLFKNQIDFLEKAKNIGFNVFQNHMHSDSIEEIFEFIQHWEKNRSELPFEIDGVVLKVNDFYQREILGFTSKFPRWAMAYKFKPENTGTSLNSISFQVGRTGSITPVANLEPVNLAGTIVKRASLHNADFIESMDIRVGDYVYVEKGGDIIPKITNVDKSKRAVDSKKFEFPEYCPECGSKLCRLEGEANHYCLNYNGCKPQIIGRIQHYISRKALDIEGLGQETVALLVNANLIKNYSDLYDLKFDQVVHLDRMADKSANNLLEGIIESKKIPFERVLYGLGIRYVGETVAKKLAKHFERIDNMLNTSFDELILVDEIGEKIANSILEFASDDDNIQIINKLKKNGVSFEIDESDKNVSSILSGKSFVISGVFSNFSRDELKRFIETNGGKISSSLSSKTSYLVAGANMGPSKKLKAEKLNINIISENELTNLVSGQNLLF
ncbi:MAG: NAD-dependent DNA ligase LigA [Flavobacteriaceae bacterium]|nr:NAD-dependent DNA ligase LigA [Flavobacteriaceae bacterium]